MFTKTLTFVTSAQAYAANKTIGAPLPVTLAVKSNLADGFLNSIQLIDKDNQKSACTVLIFDSEPVTLQGWTLTDCTTVVAGNTDAKKRACIASVQVAAADWSTIGGVAIATLKNLRLPLKPASVRTFYVAIVSQGTPTYASTSSVLAKLVFEKPDLL